MHIIVFFVGSFPASLPFPDIPMDDTPHPEVISPFAGVCH